MARSRASRAVLAALLAVGFAPFLTIGSAHADASYEAVANATGTKLIFSNQSIPLGVAPQLQGPTAQAKQTSLHQSDAYAAFPYPGDDLAGLPGVVGGALNVPAPAYPFVVTTAYGDDIRRLSYPGIELSSESGETITQASATGGSKGVGATSIARIARDGDSVAAFAGSDADGLRLGDFLVLNGLRATASAARDATGKLTRSTSLSFSSLSVPGLALTVPAPPGSAGGPQKLTAPAVGFSDGNFTVSLPGAQPSVTPVPMRDVFAAFEKSGYHITYQAPQTTLDGVIGAGLQIATTLPAPPPGAPAGLSGETPVTLSIGLARSEISYRAIPVVAGAPTAAAPNVAAPDLAAPNAVAPSVVAPTAVAPLSLPTAVDSAGLGTTLAEPARSSTTAVPAQASARQLDLTSLAAVRAPLHSDVSWLYRMVAAVGIAGFASIVALRLAGGRG